MTKEEAEARGWTFHKRFDRASGERFRDGVLILIEDDRAGYRPDFWASVLARIAVLEEATFADGSVTYPGNVTVY